GSGVRLDRAAAPSLVWAGRELPAFHPGAAEENGDSMNLDYLLASAAFCIGSVPGAFSGVLVARALGHGQEVQDMIRLALGLALLLAAAGLIARAYVRLLEYARVRDGRAAPLPEGPPHLSLRPGPTMIVGALGGLVVGLTSVGSGSLI